MALYLSSYITGFADIVEAQLRRRLPDIDIKLSLDGLVMYKTSADINQLRQLTFLNNSFIVFKHLKTTSPNALHTIAVEALKLDLRSQLLATLPHRTSTFRLKTFQANQPVAIDRHLQLQIEQQLNRNPYLRLDKQGSQLEFWCFTRREGYAFFALKITNSPNYEKTLAKGQLRPELAQLLCLLSKPQARDIFLDPFAGYGSIPLARAKLMPASQIIAADKDPHLVKHLRQAISDSHRPVQVRQLDALHTNLGSQSITAIVTDPPWGLFEKDIHLPTFYAYMLTEFSRLLKPGGTAVVLTAQADLFHRLLANHAQLTLSSVHTTLVSGRKASVFLLTKA